MTSFKPHKPDCPFCSTSINVNDSTGSSGAGNDENGNYSIQDSSYYSCSKCKGSFTIKLDYIKYAKKNIIKRVIDPNITGTSG